MPSVRLEDRTQLHLFATAAGPLLNRRTARKQIKATTHVASPILGIKMRAVMLVLQEVTVTILMTHGTSSMPSVMDDPRMKPINS